jgi:hypothetical protein
MHLRGAFIDFIDPGSISCSGTFVVVGSLVQEHALQRSRMSNLCCG